MTYIPDGYTTEPTGYASVVYLGYSLTPDEVAAQQERSDRRQILKRKRRGTTPTMPPIERKPVLAQRPCKGCGTLFTPRDDRHLYCNIDCRHPNRKKRPVKAKEAVERPCIVCGAIIATGTRKTCSDACLITVKRRSRTHKQEEAA